MSIVIVADTTEWFINIKKYCKEYKLQSESIHTDVWKFK